MHAASAVLRVGVLCLAGACAGAGAPSRGARSTEQGAARPPQGADAHACPRPNPVEAYLRNAELQAEDDQQHANVRRAIVDLSVRSAEELSAQRYANYQGVADQWDLPTLLRHHFVPDHPAGLPEGDAFWACATAEPVRAIARAIVQRIDHPGDGSP